MKRLLIATVTLAIAFAGALGLLATSTEYGQAGSIAVDFSFEVPGAGCSTKGGDTKCDVDVGTPFTVEVSLNGYSGFPNPDSDGKTGYISMEVGIDTNTDDLVLKPRSGTAEMVWPDCDTGSAGELTTPQGPGVRYSVFCGVNGNESVFLGVVAEVDYTCATAGSGTITLLGTNTRMNDENGVQRTLQNSGGGQQVLSVNCNAAVGGLAVDLDGDLGDLPLETAQSSGGNAGLLAALIAGISAVAVTVTGAAWYARRRWIS